MSFAAKDLAFEPKIFVLPGQMGVEFQLPLTRAKTEALVASLPPTYVANIQEIHQGTQLVLTLEHGYMLAKLGRPAKKKGRWTLFVAVVSEEQRLRDFAARVRLPIPTPKNLDAQLELWKEAEQATYRRQVKRARTLWNKLADQKQLSHLAELRIAELFLMTGHVNEAITRLRNVSASYPRSMGAALARLTALGIEAVIQEGHPSAAQVILAAQSGNYRRFRNFADLRAAYALVDLEQEELALARFPEVGLLPKIWKAPAKELAATAVARAIYRPLLHRQIADAIAQYEAWQHWVARHPKRDLIERDIADAYLSLGLSGPAISLIRSQLERMPDKRGEARLVQQLVHAYHMQGADDHELESFLFMWEHHPETPGIESDLRSLLLARYKSQGWKFAAATGKIFLEKKGTPALERTLLETLADLAMAEDRPDIALMRLRQRRAVPPEPSLRHQADYALALSRVSPSKEAVSQLRSVIGKITASQLHDQLAYALAQTEGAIGNHEAKLRVLDELLTRGSIWGLLARAQRREIALDALLSGTSDEGISP